MGNKCRKNLVYKKKLTFFLLFFMINWFLTQNLVYSTWFSGLWNEKDNLHFTNWRFYFNIRNCCSVWFLNVNNTVCFNFNIIFYCLKLVSIYWFLYIFDGITSSTMILSQFRNEEIGMLFINPLAIFLLKRSASIIVVYLCHHCGCFAYRISIFSNSFWFIKIRYIYFNLLHLMVLLFKHF